MGGMWAFGPPIGSPEARSGGRRWAFAALAKAPPPPEKLADEVRDWVTNLAAAGAPSAVVVDGRVAPQWGARSQVHDPSKRPPTCSPFRRGSTPSGWWRR